MGADAYLHVLAILIIVIAGVSLAVMSWTLVGAARDYRETAGAERTYAGWVLSRTVAVYLSILLALAIGVVAAYYPPESVFRIQFGRHAILSILLALMWLGLSGPVERRSIQRALSTERKGVLVDRLEEAAREAEDRFSESELEKAEVRAKLEAAAKKSRDELDEATQRILAEIRERGA